jgi:ElaB/YqjD/DUF883 family membrane-anchored ribosome-binding protein
MISNMSSMVANIRTAAVLLGDTGKKLVEDTRSLAERAETQGQHLQQTSMHVKTVSETVARNAQAAQEVSMMTASLLLPLTGVGLDAAVGLLISALVQQRVYSVLVQIILIILRLLLLSALLLAVTQFTLGALPLDSAPAWLLMGGFAVGGDWGLSFLHLGFFSEIWAIIPFGILLGAALLGFALLQSALSEWLLAFAIRRAEQIG